MQNLTDEIKDLLLTRSLLLQRVSNSLTKDIINAYVSVIDDILAQIATGKNINLVNMNKIINELNAKLSPDLTSVSDDLVQLGISEASYIANGINGSIGIDLVSKLPTDRTVQKIVNTSLMDGLTISEWLGKQDKSFQETLTKQIRLGVIEGETNPQIVSRLKSALDIKNNNNVKTIVRTAVATVTNQVRMETYKENEDIFKGYEHNSTLDARVSLICASRDGATYDLEYKGLNEKGKQYPFKQVPLHFNCRSIILPITKTFRELGLDIDEIPSGTRSSIDGRVSTDTTFEQWFEGKSATFQESYLGKSRYQLFKDGKITFSDLVNQNGRTLSIAELSKISPVAKVSNIPTIDFGYDGKFNKYVENIRDEAKIVIDKLPKPNKIEVEDYGMYNSSTRLLTTASTIEPQRTFIHEYGHHLDFMLEKDGKYSKINPSLRLFEPFDLDRDIKTEERSNIFSKVLNQKENTAYAGLHDILDAQSNGLMQRRGFIGHGKDYWDDMGYNEENFANMFQMWSENGEIWEETKILFPNTTKEFDLIMKDIIDGKFD